VTLDSFPGESGYLTKVGKSFFVIHWRMMEFSYLTTTRASKPSTGSSWIHETTKTKTTTAKASA